jgi:transposase
MDTKFKSVNLFFQDESRFGMFTRNGKALTANGIKPICPFHQVFQSTYLFGAFSPLNGESLLLKLPNCNTENFQHFLKKMSEQNPEEFKIMVLDNGAFHKAKHLIIPENIALLFLPPYSPELNPAEKIWACFKRKFTNLFHNSLEEVKDFLDETTKSLTPEMVISICSFEYIKINEFWTK